MAGRPNGNASAADGVARQGQVRRDDRSRTEIGALLLALFAALTAFGIHNFWTLTDPGQRQTERFSFFRNLTYLGAALALFAFFVSVGDKLKFTITGPLFRF